MHIYTELILKGDLHDVEIQATKRVNTIIEQLKEKMKNNDMLYFVGMMNNFKKQAEKIIKEELIYV